MKKAFFLRYLLVGLLAAGATIAMVFAYDESPLTFWLWVVLSAAAVVAVCALLAFRGASTLVESVDSLNEELELHDEQMSFRRLPENNYPEIVRLHGNIRRLCGKIIAGRKKLRRQQEQFDLVINSMDGGILITEMNGSLVLCNRKAAAVLGFPADASQQNIRDLVQDETILKAVQEAAVRNQGTSFDLETVDGSVYLLNVGLVREEAVEGSSLPRRSLIVITLADVTSERTARNRQREFFSNASHELKTPVTSIRGFSELLETGIITDPDKVQDSVRIIRREASRIDRIISDILMISTLEDHSRQSGDPAPVHIAQLLDEIRESLLVSMGEKKITMEISGGDFTIPVVYEHMHNLFGNLMQNAVKYNVEGGKVWVRAETDGQYLYATVKDTGIGIPDDMKTRVFERFFRVDKGRSRSVGGTGLGLPIVRHIVDLYSGTIQLDSRLGEGTTVTAKLLLKNE